LSYKPSELFDENGKILSEIKELSPVGDKRMGINPIANGGINSKKLVLDD